MHTAAYTLKVHIQEKQKRNIPFTFAQRITKIVLNLDQQKKGLQELIEFLKDCH